MISNFRRVLNVVCFLLGNSPASEFHMPPMKMEETECSETSVYKIQTPGNYPEESIQTDFIFSLKIAVSRKKVMHYG